MSVARHKKGVASWVSKPVAQTELSGSAHMLLVAVMTALFVSGGGYLFAVNQNAVQGYHMRSLEKEINILTQKNAELRITEADLRSLHRIEEASSQELHMEKPGSIKYVEEHSSVAWR